MAFVRLNGNRILIVQSVREGKKVRQKTLHVFRDINEALNTVTVKTKWNLLCDAIEESTPFKKTGDREELRLKIIDIAEKANNVMPENQLVKTIRELKTELDSFREPLVPEQVRVLESVCCDMQDLTELINQKIVLLNAQKDEGNMEYSLIDKKDHSNQAEALFEEGMVYHEQGNWQKAKYYFHQGLKHDPGHVDLLVHAGLEEYLEHNYHLALTYFDKAAAIGQKDLERKLKDFPEDYKIINHDKAIDSAFDGEDYDYGSLYSNLELRPFFRALNNKVLTEMQLSRYDDAIKTLNLWYYYDSLSCETNMFGLCYLYQGKLENANEWYIPGLHSVDYYYKGLILTGLNHHLDALKYFITGILTNPYIAEMLLGKIKPLKNRYYGQVLPEKIDASEIYHESLSLFKKYSYHKVLLNQIFQDSQIAECIDEIHKHTDDKGAIKHNAIAEKIEAFIDRIRRDREYLSQVAENIYEKICNPESEGWIPTPDTTIKIKVVEVKSTNWVVELVDNPNKLIYFRISAYIGDDPRGEILEIKVNKSWMYKKNIYITGQILTSG